MKQEQADLQQQRLQVKKDLRNAERKRRRLKDKAKLLSNTDLLAVLELRGEASRPPPPPEPAAVPAAAAAEPSIPRDVPEVSSASNAVPNVEDLEEPLQDGAREEPNATLDEDM